MIVIAKKKVWKDGAKSNYGSAAVHGAASCALPVQGRFKGDRFNMQIVSPGLRHFLRILSVLNSWWIWGLFQRALWFNGLPWQISALNTRPLQFLFHVFQWYSLLLAINHSFPTRSNLQKLYLFQILVPYSQRFGGAIRIHWSSMRFFRVTTIGFFIWMLRILLKERPHPPWKQKSQYQSRTNS